MSALISWLTQALEVLAAIALAPLFSGWIAQWQEMLSDPEQKIARPRQIYLGPEKRVYAAMEQRRSA